MKVFLWSKWKEERKANATVEAALVFPIMITMLFGGVDIGMGLLINKKLISASQIAADLITRESFTTDDELDQAIEAARLAMDPYATGSFGIDVAGIQFQGADAQPAVDWRTTVNMLPNGDVLIDAAGLGAENEGVVAVTTVYTFTPPFGDILTGNIQMQEVAYARGRVTPFVSKR